MAENKPDEKRDIAAEYRVARQAACDAALRDYQAAVDAIERQHGVRLHIIQVFVDGHQTQLMAQFQAVE